MLVKFIYCAYILGFIFVKQITKDLFPHHKYLCFLHCALYEFKGNESFQLRILSKVVGKSSEQPLVAHVFSSHGLVIFCEKLLCFSPPLSFRCSRLWFTQKSLALQQQRCNSSHLSYSLFVVECQLSYHFLLKVYIVRLPVPARNKQITSKNQIVHSY